MRTHCGVLSRHVVTCAIVTVWTACLGGCSGNTQLSGQHGSGGSGSGGVSATGGSATQPGSGGTTSASGGSATGGATSTAGGNRTDGTSGGTGGSGAGGASTGGTTGGSTGLAGPAVPSDGCDTATTAKTGDNQTITVNGSSRTYNLKIPTNYDQTHPYRLIIAYHWLNGTAANVSTGSGGTIKSWYDLDTTVASNGTTVFVAPQGLNNGWSNSGGADVEFSRQLITQLESQLCIDKARIFCEGFSMGGSMSYAMACGMGDVIRGVAVHSGGTMSGCAKHDKPVAYFMTHGIKDSVCTYPSFALPPLMDFAKVNGCTNPDPSLSQTAFEALLPEPTSTAGACIEFEGCKAGYPVRSCLFVGDHTPSPDGTSGWVPKESWKFISQF